MISSKLALPSSLSSSLLTFIIRVIDAVRRDLFGPKTINNDNSNNKIFKLLINNKFDSNIDRNNNTNFCKEISPLGFHIFEFFSGYYHCCYYY